jgi:hypothetical protein
MSTAPNSSWTRDLAGAPGLRDGPSPLVASNEHRQLACQTIDGPRGHSTALLGAATGLRLLGPEHSGDAHALGWQLLSRRTSPVRRGPSGLRTTTVVALSGVRGGALRRRARPTRPGHQRGPSQERCPDQRRDDEPNQVRADPDHRGRRPSGSGPCSALRRWRALHSPRGAFVTDPALPCPCRLLGSLMSRRGRSRGHANGPPHRWSNGP